MVKYSHLFLIFSLLLACSPEGEEDSHGRKEVVAEAEIVREGGEETKIPGEDGAGSEENGNNPGTDGEAGEGSGEIESGGNTEKIISVRPSEERVTVDVEICLELSRGISSLTRSEERRVG